uniref:Uncharacterized protein n=1 Tax=Anopheles atroparvus TaxID=41427 RepID=A0AAG5DMS7_ANOAO
PDGRKRKYFDAFLRCQQISATLQRSSPYSEVVVSPTATITSSTRSNLL